MCAGGRCREPRNAARARRRRAAGRSRRRNGSRARRGTRRPGRRRRAWSPGDFGGRGHRRRLLLLDEEDRATVSGPARLGGLRALGPLLPVRDEEDAGAIDPFPQIGLGRAGPALAQRHVVLGGAAVVAVTLDEEELIRVRAKPFGVRVRIAASPGRISALSKSKLIVLRAGFARYSFGGAGAGAGVSRRRGTRGPAPPERRRGSHRRGRRGGDGRRSRRGGRRRRSGSRGHGHERTLGTTGKHQRQREDEHGRDERADRRGHGKERIRVVPRGQPAVE